MKEKLLENKKVIIVLIVFLLLSISGLTLAYFVGQIGPAATANVNLTTRTVDNLTFTTGNDITIGPVNQSNFAQGSGNKSGSTTAKATLKANTGNNSATEHYNVYLKIDTNSFIYTTANNTAELVLTVTNPAGDAQTIEGLTSVTSGGVTGYDITTKTGLIPIASNYEITSTGTKIDTWNATVTFINLNSDQQRNSAKTFKAELVIGKEEAYNVKFDYNGGIDKSNEVFSFNGSNHTIDGTVNGAEWGSNYLQFAGNSSSWVNLGPINSEYQTIEVTFSVDQLPNAQSIIIGNFETGGGGIFITSTNEIRGEYYINGSYRAITTSYKIVAGQTYHVVLSYDGYVERLFVDDVLIGSIEVEGTIKKPNNSTVMAISGNSSGSSVIGEYFKGKVYNAAIYNISKSDKGVIIDQPYGDLPTPTKSGATFLGWVNNIFPDSDLINSTKWTPNQNVTLTRTSSYAQIIYNQDTSTPGYIYKYANEVFETGKTYTVSFYIKGLDINKINLGIYGTSANYSISSTGFTKINKVLTFTTASQNFILFYSYPPTNGSGFQIKWFIVQPGEVSYDYITSDVIVDQENDHTLTAMWG